MTLVRVVGRASIVAGLAATSAASVIALSCQLVLGVEGKELTAVPASSGGPGVPGSEASASEDGALAPDGAPCSSDLATDGENCGRCGHSCGGGICTASRCGSVPLVTGARNPWSLAVDDKYLYFANEGASGDLQRVEKSPRPGNVPSQLAASSGLIRWLVASKGRIYWVDESAPGIFSSLPDGSNKKPMPSSGLAVGLAIAGDNVYWSDRRGGADTGTVATCLLEPGGGCGAAAVIATGQKSSWVLTTDGTTVAWTREPSTMMGSLSGCRSPFPCATPRLIAQNQKQISGLVAAKGRLFWAEEGDGFLDYTTGRIWSCVLPDCASSSPVASSQGRPVWLTADAEHLFWVNSGKPGTNEGSVIMCTLPDCKDPVSFVDRQSSPVQAVSDGKFVYWTLPSATTIMKRAKP